MDILGLGLVGLTMIPFLAHTGPDKTLPGRTTNVRIGAGTTGGGNSDNSMIGLVPGVALFDIGGNKIGQSDIDDTHILTFRDIPIVTSSDLQDNQPEYISLSAGKDAICIAYVTVTTSQNLKYAFVGDIAKACNLPSYYTPSQHTQFTNGYAPYCVWLNGAFNGEHEIYDGAPLQFRGMGIHITDFSSPEDASKDLKIISATYNANGDLFCRSQPRFWMYDNLTPDDYIPYFVNGLQSNPDGTDANPSQVLDSSYWAIQTPPPVLPDDLPFVEEKRNLKSLNSRHGRTGNAANGQPVVRNNITEMRLRSSYINANVMKDHLVTSNETAHSASKLCDDSSTAGPDFVSLDEQMFCDMASKQVYPLCQSAEQEACFDLDGSVLRPGALRKRDPNLVIKNYVKRIDW